MNVERLRTTATAVVDDIKRTSSVARINQVINALRQMAVEPQQPAYQQQVAQYRTEILGTLRGAPSDSFSALEAETVKSLGFDHLLGSSLAEQIEAIFSDNAMTPAVAADQLAGLAAQVQSADTTLTQLVEALDQLGVGTDELGAGEAEIAVTIPRGAFHSRFESLADEFNEIDRLIAPFQELATGSRSPLEVRSVSSSDIGVFLSSPIPVALLFMHAVDKVLGWYQTVLDIRVKRADLAEKARVPDETLAPLEAYANSYMKSKIEEAAKELVRDGVVSDEHRSHELETETSNALDGIANRIDRGYHFDARVSELPPLGQEDDESEEADTAAVAEWERARVDLQEMAPRLRYANVSGDPILHLPEHLALLPGDEPTAGTSSGQKPRPRRPRTKPVTRGEDLAT